MVADATRLGFGEPIAISAETGEGLVDLYSALQPYVDRFVKAKKRAKPSALAGNLQETGDLEEPSIEGKDHEELSDESKSLGGLEEGPVLSPGDPEAGPIKLAIVGEPNVVSPQKLPCLVCWATFSSLSPLMANSGQVIIILHRQLGDRHSILYIFHRQNGLNYSFFRLFGEISPRKRSMSLLLAPPN